MELFLQDFPDFQLIIDDFDDVGNACHLKDFHDVVVDVGDIESAADGHGLLREDDDAKTRRGNVIDLLEIHDELIDIGHGHLKKIIEFWGGVRVDGPFDIKGELFAFFFLLNSHDLLLANALFECEDVLIILSFVNHFIHDGFDDEDAKSADASLLDWDV